MMPVRRNGAAATSYAVAPFNRLDFLFDRFFGEDLPAPTAAFTRAPMALWEDEQGAHIEVDLPGLTEDALEITVHNGVLSIKAERKPVEGRKYVLDGRTVGRFERVLTLPEGVDAENVQAELKNGVLSLTLPKKPEAQPRKITLKTN